jgi:hypothetical protein
VEWEAEYFRADDWTTQIRLKLFGKLDYWRSAFSGCGNRPVYPSKAQYGAPGSNISISTPSGAPRMRVHREFKENRATVIVNGRRSFAPSRTPVWG